MLLFLYEKLPLAASDSFFSPLAGSSFPVKIPSKRHTWVSPSVVSTISKSPKIFNNRPVNKLVFPALTTLTTTSTTTASQMAAKAKNSKKQQQAVTTVMVTPNSFVVPNEIFSKISTAAASFLPDMDGNSSSTSLKMGQDQLLAVLPNVVLSSKSSPISVVKQSINPDDLKDWADQIEMESTVSPPVSGTTDSSAWKNVNGHQRFSGWVASNLVSESLTGVIKVAIGDGNFLTTLKIAQSSGVVSVSSLSLLVALYNVPLGISSDDIKTALGNFGVITSVKLKPTGLWQYAVVHFKDTFSAATALFHWLVAVHVSFSTPLILINVNGLDHLALKCKVFPPLFLKVSSDFFGGPKVFKFSFAGSKFYAKAAAIMVSPVAAAADMNLDLGGLLPTTTLMLPVAPSAINNTVEAKLASLKSHLGKLSLLIKFLVEPVGALVVLVTKLLFTLPAVDVFIKESVAELAEQNKDLAVVAIVMQKRLTCLEKKCEQVCLEDISDNNDIDNNNNNNNVEDKNFFVYDNTFNIMIHL
ncbi:hypothetical protein G9A89_007973 [Geosiphon pyriformis]|nr:hypothetical protein G9A89_007973 [Geosiphon pyriformis]